MIRPYTEPQTDADDESASVFLFLNNVIQGVCILTIFAVAYIKNVIIHY